MPGRHDVEHGESGHSPGGIAPAENLPAPDPGGERRYPVAAAICRSVWRGRGGSAEQVAHAAVNIKISEFPHAAGEAVPKIAPGREPRRGASYRWGSAREACPARVLTGSMRISPPARCCSIRIVPASKSMSSAITRRPAGGFLFSSAGACRVQVTAGEVARAGGLISVHGRAECSATSMSLSSRGNATYVRNSWR